MRLVLLLTTALACLAGFVPQGALAASSAEYIGVNAQPLMKDATIDTTRWDTYYAQLEAGRMGISRLQVSWHTTELTAPVNGVHTYNWNFGGSTSRDSVDYAIASFAKRGIRAAPLFAGVPSWASKNTYRMTSANYPDFAKFIAAFATRYGPGGAFWAERPELPYLPPYDYEIWTEANSTNFWTGTPNPPEYAAAMKVIQPALKAAQPKSVLLASLGWENINTYLDAFFAAGGGDAIDGIGFHPYAPHAPAIMSLVTGLRSKLRALGKPGFPIMITETGQPVVYTGNGAASAGIGRVTDAARAATQSFAADALARSNCQVEQFLAYGITGSETNKEPISEGFMGVLRHADGVPFLTGAALQRASLRWAEQVAAGNPAKDTLKLCGGNTEDSKLLPLGLVLTKSGATCVVGRVTYDGNPIEGARLEFQATGRATYSQEINAYGRAEVCLTDGPPTETFDVIAKIPNAGRSAVYRCDLPVTGCKEVMPPPIPPGSQPTLNDTGNGDDPTTTPGEVLCDCGGNARQVPTEIKACSWTAALTVSRPTRLKAGTKSAIVARGRLACAGQPSKQKFRFVVAVRKKVKKGKKAKDTKIRVVTLQSNRTVKFTVTAKVKKGDELVLLHSVAKKPKTILPRLRATAVLKAPGPYKKPKAKKK
ncbi:MAG: hypothetical protein JHD16_02520 [Solirubrobacteraceae bacterium]|nr:hypothetical protein [Solirubrobacteraceae bacterium]